MKSTNTDPLEEDPAIDRKENIMEEYRGFAIEFNFYGSGEYTVQYDGDDVWFTTLDEAKAFIDLVA